jgi:multiple sugar transport system substrate-binding protein
MQTKKLSRRDFLRMSALTAAGAALAGCACPPAAEPGQTVVTQVVKEEVAVTQVVKEEVEVTVPPEGATEVRWFIGLGTGTQPEQVPAEDAWVDFYNAGQGEITLVHEIVDNDVAFDTLKTQIAAGDPPDIIGPVGRRGANEFAGSWLDMEDYLAPYDLSIFSAGAVDGWKVAGQGLIGLAFGVYPSAIYVNYELFDEAGLDYPPQVYGDTYADGDDWTVEKMSDLALLLTVEANGNDATMAGFDPENIVQFGYHHQWTDPRGWATFFGAGNFVADDGVTAQCPDYWREAFNWYYDAEWVQYFAPNGPYQNSDLLAAGNPFGSGNVAMAHCHLWFTCCVPADTNWNFAIVPSYNGTTTAKLHADAISVLGASKNPDEAVHVVYDMVSSLQLAGVWGAFPSVTALQAGFLANQDAAFPQGVNWDTILAGMDYIDSPNHEDYMPNFSQADDRVKAFQSELESTSDLNVDTAVDTLVADLQAIFDAAEA